MVLARASCATCRYAIPLSALVILNIVAQFTLEVTLSNYGGSITSAVSCSGCVCLACVFGVLLFGLRGVVFGACFGMSGVWSYWVVWRGVA